MTLERTQPPETQVEQTTAKRPASRKALYVVALGLLIAYSPKYLSNLFEAIGIQVVPDNPSAILVWNWLAVTLLAGYIFKVERKNLRSIRIAKPSQKDVEWAFYFWGLSMALNWLASQFIRLDASQGISQITALPVLTVLAIIITAAITEEILYRGYVIERLRELSGQLWLGALLSFVIFILPHLTFFGWEWLPLHGTGTLLIYVYYLWRRNLVGAMVLHLLGNLPVLIPTVLS